MIHKLKYNSKEHAIQDLTDKGVIGGALTHAIVYVGQIVDVEGTYDEEGNELTAPTFIDGYHVDIMTDDVLTFENEIFPNNPKHQFA
jgi:hypothetical protein